MSRSHLTIPAASLLLLAGCGQVEPPARAPQGGAPAAAAIPPPATVAPAELPAGKRELVKDGGFENPAPGPWTENNWAKNEATFVRDPEQPFRGRFSQRLTMTKAASTADLQLLQRLDGVSPNCGMLIKLAVRGRSNARPLQAQVRRIGAPYTTYGSMRIPPTAHWQEHAFVATLPKELPSEGVGIYVHLQDESVAWVDEVSVSLLAERDARGPLAGNLVYNGSFEAGRARWILYNRDAAKLHLGPAADENMGAPDGAVVEVADAPQGRRVMRFAVKQHCAAYLGSAYFPYRHGHPLTASARIRARSGGGTVELSLGHGETPNTTWIGKGTISATSDWQTIKVACTPGPSAAGGAFLQIFSSAPGEYEVDDVRVEQAPAAAGAVAPLFGCALVDAPAGGVFRGDERPRLALRATGLPAGKPVEAALRISDAWERTAAYLTVDLTADAAGEATTVVELPRDQFGGFRCALEVAGRLQAEALYSVVPALPKPDGSARSFFGGHFRLNPYALDLAERAGMRWLRLHPPLDTKWMVAEPEQGKLAFPTAGIERALARGFNVLGSLDTCPEWAATPGIDQPYTWWRNRVPRDWAQWSNYVQAALRAFPGIRHWEIYNEPDIDFLLVPKGVDKAAAYTEIMTRTRTAIDELARSEPKLAQVELVGLPVSSLDRPFFREVIAKGGAAQVDSLGFHFYYEDQDPLEKRPDFLEQLAAMRAARNRSSAEPGIWHTEGGIWIKSAPSWFALSGLPDHEGTTQLDGAHTVVRTAVALKALGVKRHFHYAATGNAGLMWRTECSSMIDLDGSARPSLAAHAAMVWQLDDAQPKAMDTVQAGGAAVRLARFTSPRGAITVAWARGDLAAAQVPGLLAGASEVRDLMGNQLMAEQARVTIAPIYVRYR